MVSQAGWAERAPVGFLPNETASAVYQDSGDRQTMDELTEELEGNGKILLDGIELGEVSYSIQVRKAGIKGWQYPFARFMRRGYLEFYDLLNKPITLVLEDGRRWNCRISNLDGSVVALAEWPAKI